MEMGGVIVKNKILLILLMLILVSGVLAVGSFLMLDEGSFLIKEGKLLDFEDLLWKMGEESSHKIYTQDLDTFESLYIGDCKGVLKLVKGPNKIEVYSDKKNTNIRDIPGLIITNGKLEIQKLQVKENTAFVIYVEDWSKIDATIDDLDGVLVVEQPLNNLKIDEVEGVFTVNSPRAFNMDIGKADGVLKFNFDEADLELTIDKIHSVGSIFGQKSITLDGESLNTIKDDGTYKIHIKSLSGVADMR